MKYYSFSILLVLFLFSSCEKEKEDDILPAKICEAPIPSKPTPFNLDLPEQFTLVLSPFIPDSNPLTVEGIALGKKLFFEKRLSKNNSISCASCHKPFEAFNDQGNAKSPGHVGSPSLKNTMPLFNLAFNSRSNRPNTFHWNGKANSLEEQALLPVRDPIEMGEDWRLIAGKLSQDPMYPRMFAAAFGSEIIDSTQIIKAIAQFERTLISGESRADNQLRVMLGLPINGDTLTPQELRGYQLYVDEGKGDCSHCHGLGINGASSNPLWTNFDYVNNGLDLNPDSGLAAITKNGTDIGKFKTPSLRNLVFTNPYMHDGRFNTLEEVVEFYTTGVQTSSPNLDGFMTKSRNLSVQEKADLVAFLKSITDSSFVTNPAFRP